MMKKLKWKMTIVLWFLPLCSLIAGLPQDNPQGEGRIVFYSGEFDTAAAMKQEPTYVFTPGEELAATVILPEPLSGLYDKMNWRYNYELEKFNYNFAIDFYIDGEHRAQWLDELPRELFEDFRYYNFMIIPSVQEKLEYSLYVSDWVDIIKGLPAGDHRVKMEFRAANTENPPGTSEPLASGKFTLRVDDESKKTFLENYRISLPEATLYSKELSISLIKAAQGAFDDMVPIAAVIVEPTGEWQYTRDRTGMVERRYITAAIALSGVEDECFVRTALFSQEMIEPGLYRDLRFVKELEDFYNYSLPCENVIEERKE